MVRWTPFILLIALTLAALPGRVSIGCDDAMASTMGCDEVAIAVGTGPADSCCGASAPEPADIAPSAEQDRSHACALCAVVCGSLCEKTNPWGILGIGFGTDGLSHAAPSGVLLPATVWLPREASERPPFQTALLGEWLTADRPRRQAKLCLWTV